MARVTKRRKEVLKYLDKENKCSLSEALDRITQCPKAKFDESVDVHLSLNIDTESSDQNIRGTVVLPHGTGKNIKIAVFCKGEVEQKAKTSGADYVGSTELIEKVSNGFIDFDVVIATPDMMRDLSRLGKILGPRGLMPTPKAGTVTMDVEKAIKEVRAGRIEFKSDKQGGIHVSVGKRSFPKEKLLENVERLLEAVRHVSPEAIQANLIKSMSIAATMGPGVGVAI